MPVVLCRTRLDDATILQECMDSTGVFALQDVSCYTGCPGDHAVVTVPGWLQALADGALRPRLDQVDSIVCSPLASFDCCQA